MKFQHIFCMKHNSDIYKIYKLHVYDDSKTSNALNTLLPSSRIEILKLFNFDTFEDFPIAPTGVFTKQYENQCAMDELFLYDTSTPSKSLKQHK